MIDDEIPAALLRRHPELLLVGQALDAHRRGESIQLACPRCGGAIVVHHLEAVHVTVVKMATNRAEAMRLLKTLGAP